jgi:hypothetical protein
MRQPENLEELEPLVGRAILNAKFRRWLLADPQAAAESMGIQLTDGQVAHIKGLDPKAVTWWMKGAEYAVGPKGLMPLW